MAVTDPPEADGLRERKKRRTRTEISDVATRLFFKHGFEEVTLAQIAEAAEVSVKTIFNHFGSKEDLYFDRWGEVISALEATVIDRAPGTTVLGALRALLVDNRVPLIGAGWAGLGNPRAYAGFRAFLATQDRSPALRARRLTLSEEMGDRLRQLLAVELRRPVDDPALASLTALLVGVLNLRDRVLRAAIAAERPYEEVRDAVVAVVEESMDRLATAFRDIDRAA